MTSTGNFAELILRHADAAPARPALILPIAWTDSEVTEHRLVTFAALAHRMRQFRAGLHERGIGEGHRVVLLFPVGLELYALVLALFAAGAAVVLIDTGMGAKKILRAIRDSRADAIVAPHALLRHRFWLPALWFRKRFCTDARGLLLQPFGALLGDGDPVGERRALFAITPRSPADHALITFTSGSTGRPKGADRTHGLLTAQHLALRDHFPDAQGEVDMPCFPVVTLHNLCCGIPTVLPPVDFKAVAQVQPDAVLSFAERWGVTRMSGAPAYMARIADALEAAPSRLPTLRAAGIGGARVPVPLARRWLALRPGAELLVLYGSTEAEPIASVPMTEVVEAADAGDEGVLVGREAEAATVELVDLPDPPPPIGPEGLAPYRVPDGEPGELVVSGPHVNRGYLDDPAADAENKLFGPGDPQVRPVWHRTGDVARRDAEGRLWLVGRVRDMVSVEGRSTAPYPIEEAVEALPGVVRAALVQLGSGPVLALEGDGEAQQAARALLAARGLAAVPVRPLAIPVDGRHNSKVDRVALRATLEGR